MLFLFSKKYQDIIIILLHVILLFILVIKITIETAKTYKNTSIIEYFFMLLLPILVLPEKYHSKIFIITTAHFVYSLVRRFYL
jgi:hypothetical protein